MDSKCFREPDNIVVSLLESRDLKLTCFRVLCRKNGIDEKIIRIRLSFMTSASTCF
jgi:hypothetical protein